MKYRRLTKEQLEAMPKEFAKFLASQQIDKKEWDVIKATKPKVVEEELDIFSDLVWEDVLNKVSFIEHFSKSQLNLFLCGKTEIKRILIKVDKLDFDFFVKENYEWFLAHQKDKCISYYKASKNYEKSRNREIFEFIEKGAIITNGDLFKSIQAFIK